MIEKDLESRENFFSYASHELASPITLLQGFAEILQDHPDLPKEKVQEIGKKMVSACHHLQSLLESLSLLGACSPSLQEEKKNYDLQEIISSCEKRILARYPKAKISIEKKGDSFPLYVHKELLEIAIDNLLDNGIKYSPSPAKLSILIEKDSKGVHLHIIDKGIGIAKQELSKIFTRFYRGSSLPLSMKGTGLGLTLVKEIIEKQGGEINLHSQLGKGTKVSLFFPL